MKGEEALVQDFRANLSFVEIGRLVDRCAFWLTVDSFLPHLAQHQHKPGVVIWSVSDPLIFGYRENLNLLKDRAYLRSNQWAVWEDCAYNTEAFIDPVAVLHTLIARLECVA